MKKAFKNILIITELVIIVFLSVAVVFFYRKSNQAVQTSASIDTYNGNISDNSLENIEDRISENYYSLSGKKILLEDGTYGEIWIPAEMSDESIAPIKTVQIEKAPEVVKKADGSCFAKFIFSQFNFILPSLPREM